MTERELDWSKAGEVTDVWGGPMSSHMEVTVLTKNGTHHLGDESGQLMWVPFKLQLEPRMWMVCQTSKLEPNIRIHDWVVLLCAEVFKDPPSRLWHVGHLLVPAPSSLIPAGFQVRQIWQEDLREYFRPTSKNEDLPKIWQDRLILNPGDD